MDVLDLTQALMRFKSTRSRPEELRACFAFMEDFLTRRGVGFRRFEQNGVPTLLVLRPDGTAPVLLMSHVDVVDAADELFEPRVENGRLYRPRQHRRQVRRRALARAGGRAPGTPPRRPAGPRPSCPSAC